MPRDLTSPEAKSEPLLTASPDSQTSAGDTKAIDQDGYSEFTIHGGSYRSNTTSEQLGADKKNLSDLHPHVQTLSLSDVDICVALENATFPEPERCSREKVSYPPR